MRLIRVTVPEGKAHDIAQIAFANGVEQVTIRAEEARAAKGETRRMEALEATVATPVAKRFLDGLLSAPAFDPATMSVAQRKPVSIVTHQPIGKLTRPVFHPATDVMEDLWQFSHVTISLVLRILIAAALLAHGVLHDHLILMVGGLLFIPVLPPLMAIGFGAMTGRWRLAGQGLLTCLLGLGLVLIGGALVGWIEPRPIEFQDFPELKPSFIIAALVGIAAALANSDDAGKRELIGLAAAAQISLVPIWFGLAWALGTISKEVAVERALSLGLNLAAIVVTSALTYTLIGYKKGSLARLPADA